MANPAAPIGIFDSGVGGLTVLARIAEHSPSERIVYLGDTARVPYGTKSPDTVVRYARACARILLKSHVKIIVVACNTASAFALETLRDELPIPVLGVIEPGAQRAVETTRNRIVGIVGTSGTIGSGVYQDIITSRAPDIRVHAAACPLFVPLAEEGWLTGPVPELVASKYLEPMLGAGMDTLVLGCTHYPLLKPAISTVTGPGVTLVDSAEATAAVVAETIDGLGLANTEGHESEQRFLVTDDPLSFRRLGRLFLGRDLHDIEWVDIS